MKKSIKTAVMMMMIGSSSLWADPAPVHTAHLAGMDADVDQQQMVDGTAAPTPGSALVAPNAIASPQMGVADQMQAMQDQMRQMQGQLELQAHQIVEMQKKLQGVAPAIVATPTRSGTNTQMSNALNTSPTILNVQAANTSSTATAPIDAAQAKAVLTEEQIYQQAYQQLLNKQYGAAKAGMQDYLQKYPQGTFAGNAHYWNGELALISGDSKQALAQFNAVIKDFPDSAKASDAMLKIGFIYYDEQQFAQANTALHNVITKYPNSSTAELAKQRLTMMQKQGVIASADV